MSLPFETLLRHRRYWRWSAGVQLARLPSAMAPLAFTVLTTAITGSYRLGGLMMSVYVIAELAGAVPAGRLIDRIGPAKGLVLLLVCASAGLGGLATAASAGTSGMALLVLVVVPGAISGGLSGGFRTLLAGTISDDLLPRDRPRRDDHRRCPHPWPRARGPARHGALAGAARRDGGGLPDLCRSRAQPLGTSPGGAG
jgi:MFS family permease